MKKNFFALTLLFISVLTSCKKETNAPPENTPPDLKAEFNVAMRSEFQNTIYPSFIFGWSELEKQSNEVFDYFKITVNPNVETDIKIVIQESTVNNETIITESSVVGKKEIIPSLKWKYENLKYLSQPGYVDITFVCYGKNDKEIGRKTLKLGYRAINECVYYAKLDNEDVSFLPFLAGYVNEESPIIQPFLQEVLQENPNLNGFIGYQGSEQDVDDQVKAIFNTLRVKGVKYSSITNTSNSNPNIGSQYIRFCDEVLDNTQANCADGTAFFCSVLKKIDINPVMIFEPGHVYLGYYTNKEKTKITLLETTLVGNLNFTFENAIDFKIESFNQNREKIFDENLLDDFFFLDIDKVRAVIKPIGR